MQILQEIIDLLSSDKPSLENALFKAQVLAHRLGEAEMKQWVNNELKGYPDKNNLPDYRILPVTVMANVTNGYQVQNNHPLPMMRVKEKVRNLVGYSYLTESIAVIENWSKDESKLTRVIPPEFNAELGAGLDKSFQILRAWGQHGSGAMLQVAVEVRSRLLDMALQVADRIPADPAPSQIKRVAEEVAVTDIFKNVVFGSNTTIVVGNGSIQGITNSVVNNDVESLVKAMQASGVDQEDTTALRDAIAKDANSPEVADQKLGPSVRGWMTNMLGKAGSGIWRVGLTAAGTVMGKALSAYYGFTV